MKTFKVTLAALMILSFVSSITYGDSNIFPADGDVGIGTTTPTVPLDVVGDIRTSGDIMSSYGFLTEYTAANRSELIYIWHLAGPMITFGITPDGEDSTTWTMGKTPEDNETLDVDAGSFYISDILDGPVTPKGLAISPVGTVNILAPESSTDYALIVNGKLGAREIVVTQNNFADYVFGNDYELPALDEVKSYIDENKHLPGVPSARKIKEEGMPVSDMLRIQMEKIEELTLYVISLKDENVELKERLSLIENSVN